jgi:hypothetical protein
MQAGLIGKRLTLREIFWSGSVFLAWCEKLVFVYLKHLSLWSMLCLVRVNNS